MRPAAAPLEALAAPAHEGRRPASTRLSEAYFEIMDRFAAIGLVAESFETYWQVNAPVPAATLTEDFGLSLRTRA